MLDLCPYPSDGRKPGVTIDQLGLPLPQSGLLAGLKSLEIIFQFLVPCVLVFFVSLKVNLHDGIVLQVQVENVAQSGVSRKSGL